MSPEASAPDIIEFDVPTQRPPDIPVLTFKLNGQTFRVRQPKLGIATNMIALMERRGATVQDFGLEMTRILRHFLGYVEVDDTIEPAELDDGTPNPNAGLIRGLARIEQRLSDPNDSMDILDLQPLFAATSVKMFARPTGPSGVSTPPPDDAGPDSAADSSEPTASTPSTSPRNSSSRPAKTSRTKGSSSARRSASSR